MSQIERRQTWIGRDAGELFMLDDQRIDRGIFVSQAVKVTESNQRPDFQS
jgi:hypothetical protein